MAKKATNIKELVVDRVALVGLLLAATAYIVRDTWAGMFFEAGAIIVAVMWSFRVINTNSKKELKLLAALIIVLVGALLAFYLGAARGLL